MTHASEGDAIEGAPAHSPARIEAHRARAELLQFVRKFFRERGVLEVETRLFNPTGAVEAHLDSFAVRRRGVRKSPQAPQRQPAEGDADAGYLITSPEYNLKILLAELRCNLMQIAHCFREGDYGDLHREEFLMLEWYLLDADEHAFMDQCEDLLRGAAGLDFLRTPGSPPPPAETPFPRLRVRDLLRERVGLADWDRASLIDCVRRLGLAPIEANNAQHGRDAAAGLDAWPYDDLFFTIFLNEIERELPDGDSPCFVYDYPPELAALARIEADAAGRPRARRFEIYWRGLELANGYNELTDAGELEARFARENELRRALGKPEMRPDPQLLAALRKPPGMPAASGAALGLDRLFLALCGAPDFNASGLGDRA